MAVACVCVVVKTDSLTLLHQLLNDMASPSLSMCPSPLLTSRVVPPCSVTATDGANEMQRSEGAESGKAWTFHLPSNTDSLEGLVADVCRFLLDKSLVVCPDLKANLDISDKRKLVDNMPEVVHGKRAIHGGLLPDAVSAFIEANCESSNTTRDIDDDVRDVERGRLQMLAAEACTGSSTASTATRLVLELTPAAGVYSFKYRGTVMELELRQLERVHSVMQGLRLARRVDVILRVPTMSCLSQNRAARAVAALCADAHTWAESLQMDTARSVKIHLNKDGYWSLSYKNKRCLSTVYLPAHIKDKAKAEVARFLRERAEYEKFGVPYRRCFLLAGPPGTGKTSLIHALASTFDLAMYVLSITPKTDDHALSNQLSAAGDKRSVSMVVLEDVDALFGSDRTAASSAAASVSFSGLLNALDGLGSPTGLILCLTTNYLERLDPALIRPGRVDTILRFEHLTREQVGETWCKLLPHAAHALPAFLRKLESSSACNRQLAPATLQKFLFDHREDSPEAILGAFSELEELASYFKARHAMHEGAYEAYTS